MSRELPLATWWRGHHDDHGTDAGTGTDRGGGAHRRSAADERPGGGLLRGAGAGRAAARRIVLVAGPLRERHLPRLFGAGVVSILPCRDLNPRQIVRTVFATHTGRAVLPDVLARWLVDEMRSAQSDLLATQGLTSGG